MDWKDFGLTGYEAQAYDTLLKKGTMTAHQLAKFSKVPSGKIYPTLESLTIKGFVRVTEGTPKLYTGVPAEISTQGVVDQEQEKVSNLKEQAKGLVHLYAQFPKEKESPTDTVEVYFSHKAAFARSIVLHQQATKYWKTLSGLSVHKKHLDATCDAMKRGVRVQALTRMDVTNKERIDVWKERKIPVKIISSLPFRASIYDDWGVIFRFEEGKQYVSVHIRNAKLAKGMREMFDEMWKKGQ